MNPGSSIPVRATPPPPASAASSTTTRPSQHAHQTSRGTGNQTQDSSRKRAPPENRRGGPKRFRGDGAHHPHETDGIPEHYFEAIRALKTPEDVEAWLRDRKSRFPKLTSAAAPVVDNRTLQSLLSAYDDDDEDSEEDEDEAPLEIANVKPKVEDAPASCHNYARGKCRFGESCRYAHDLALRREDAPKSKAKKDEPKAPTLYERLLEDERAREDRFVLDLVRKLVAGRKTPVTV